VSFIAKNLHLIKSKDRESSVIQTGSILNSILGAHWSLFVTSAHSRQEYSSKDRQPGLPGIGGEKVKHSQCDIRSEATVVPHIGHLKNTNLAELCCH
jgi:hypothetical protein